MKFNELFMSALSDIEDLFDSESLNEFKKHKYNDLSNYHFTLGLHIRNEILTVNSDLYNVFIKSGVVQKDELSSLLIELFYFYIKSKSP